MPSLVRVSKSRSVSVNRVELITWRREHVLRYATRLEWWARRKDEVGALARTELRARDWDGLPGICQYAGGSVKPVYHPPKLVVPYLEPGTFVWLSDKTLVMCDKILSIDFTPDFLAARHAELERMSLVGEGEVAADAAALLAIIDAGPVMGWCELEGEQLVPVMRPQEELLADLGVPALQSIVRGIVGHTGLTG